MTTRDTDAIEVETVDTAVQAGETLGVGVTVEHADEGDGGDETVAALVVDGAEADTATLEPDPGETASADLEWTAPPDAVGTVEVTVRVADRSTTETVTVEDAPASFAVGIDSVDEFVSPDGRVTVNTTVENEGTVEGSQTVEFLAGGETEETRLYSLDGQASEAATFSHAVSSDDAPELALAVTTESDEAETSVAVVDRTVTPLRQLRSKSGMGVFGWLLFLGMAVLLLPLLPFIALVKLLDVLFGQQLLA